MDAKEARATLDQLVEYTKSVAQLIGIKYDQHGRNSYGPWGKDRPFGAITHYTASNMAISKRRPYGRLPVLLNRFARGSAQKVGVQFIVWDRLEDRFANLRNRYDLLKDMAADVLHFGDDLAYWHAGWVNKWCYGIEIRNCGQLTERQGVYFWKQQRHRGRKPVRAGLSLWEPYTKEQMITTLWLHRLMASIHNIRPEWFLGHREVSSTRIDPGKHFPMSAMREYALFQPDVPLDQVPFLSDFAPFDGVVEDENLVEEDKIHKGLFRHDWDGVPSKWRDDCLGKIERDDEAEGLGTVAMAKMMLRVCGYWPGKRDDAEVTPEFSDSLRAFQGRWKKRGKGGRWVNELEITGKLDKVTYRKLEGYVKMVEAM